MDDKPRCPKCGQEMKLVASLPAEGGFPAVEGFRCDECDEEITREVE
jgi:tRNA(Ile2) C34 agmatinyltransferase TiaS